MSEQPIIELRDVSVGYEGHDVLTGVNLTVRERDFLGVIGPNGGGKTTLMKAMLGLMKPSQGTITYLHDGAPVPRLNIGYMPQYTSIDKKFPISVADVVLSGLSHMKPLLRPFSREQKEQCREVLRQMELDTLADRQIGKLSGGQLQRVLLARAVVSDPEVLVLDEPNTYIDRKTQQKLYQRLTEINCRCAIVLVSHDIDSVLTYARSIACVDGEVLYHDSATLSTDWVEKHLGNAIGLIGRGDMRYRLLKTHGY